MQLNFSGCYARNIRFYPGQMYFHAIAGVDPMALYPEYLADYHALYCPSNIESDPEKALYVLHEKTDDPTPCTYAGLFMGPSGCYQYIGYLFDKADDVPSSFVPDNWQMLVPQMYWFGASRPPTNPEDSDRAIDSIDDQQYGNGDTGVIHKLREGIERICITDVNNPAASASAQSEIAVMWDQSAAGMMMNDAPDTKPLNHTRGANVLYMDGHAGFVDYVPKPNGKFPVTYSTFIGGASFMGMD